MSQHKPSLREVREALRSSGYVFSPLYGTPEAGSAGRASASSASNPEWLTPKEAAGRARCGVKTIYREVKAGRLRVARVGGRREQRIKPEWIDEWLERAATPVELGV